MRWTTRLGVPGVAICASVLSVAAAASQGIVTALPDISDKPIQYIVMPAEAGRLTAAQRRFLSVGFVGIEEPEAARQKVRTMKYARPPTHIMIIEWEQGGGSTRRREVTLVRDLREDASGLHELLMCPTPDVLKQFE